MSAVLIDNLSVGSITDRINARRYEFDSYIKNYLYALILWDDIYTVNGRYSVRIGDKSTKMIYDDYLGIKRLSFDYSSIEMCAEEIGYEYRTMNSDTIVVPSQVREDSIFYLLLGYNLGMNIMMSDERTRYIEKSGISQKMFSRSDILDRLDKEILNYYQEVNALIGKTIFTMKMPVLIDYIISNANSFEEAKELALRIKYDQKVIEFRKAMDLMDKALNQGNLVEFINYIEVIPEIVNSITHSGVETKTVDVGISISPSISIPFNLDKLHLKQKMCSMNFLVDLAKYGTKKEPIEFYP